MILPLALAAVALGRLPADPPPVVAAVFPPGVTVGDRATWTITGRNLGRVEAVLADPADGLHFGPVVADPAGRTLTVEVRADARPEVAGFRAIRADGPTGVSNLALVRVDPLPQVVEAGPPGGMQAIAVGSAVAGTIRPGDVDRYRVEGPPGLRVALDWESRRLGSAIIPVLTATGPGGEALGQFRSTPGGDRDCRGAVTVPAAGWFAVELRDDTYGGDDRCRYRLRVEAAEPAPGVPPPPAEAVLVPPAGLVAEGQIAAPGRVDRYRVEAKAGDRLRARVEAAASGSWLDAVVTVRGSRGEVLAEGDDRSPASPLEPPSTLDGSADPDPQVDLPIRADGPIVVEVADRFGRGGPEYGYRVEVGPPRVDFAVTVLRGVDPPDVAAEARRGAEPDASAPPPGTGGAWNLRPGSATPVSLLIVPRGRPGTIDLRLEGLPPGVEAEPIAVRLAPAPRPGTRAAAAAGWDSPPAVDSFRLRVRADAPAGLGRARIVARSRGGDGAPIDREGIIVVGVDSAGGPGRPVVRRAARFPVRVLPAAP